MERCEACGSWQEDCDCILPPWKMRELGLDDEQEDQEEQL